MMRPKDWYKILLIMACHLVLLRGLDNGEHSENLKGDIDDPSFERKPGSSHNHSELMSNLTIQEEYCKERNWSIEYGW